MSFSITPSTFEENLDKCRFDHPNAYVMENAKCKAVEVMDRLMKRSDNKQPYYIIGVDTVVVAEGKILEKPHTNENALVMLTKLSLVIIQMKLSRSMLTLGNR